MRGCPCEHGGRLNGGGQETCPAKGRTPISGEAARCGPKGKIQSAVRPTLFRPIARRAMPNMGERGQIRVKELNRYQLKS